MENQIKTFEEACEKLGVAPELSITLPEGAGNLLKGLLAHAKLVIIAQALNDGWVPDWSNGEFDKYYPWFDMDAAESSSGSRFSFDDYDYVRSFSTVGSRLCFKSRELAEYAGKQFESLYKEYFVIEK